MPQCKGSATWLTNVRQEVVQRKAGIDHSAVKIENERIEEDMRKALDNIHLAGHRARAEREYEMRETKSTAKNYEAIQSLAKEKSLDSIVGFKRPKGIAHSAGPARSYSKGANLVISQGAPRPHTGMSHLHSGALTAVDIDYNDENQDDGDIPDRAFTAKQKGKGIKSKVPLRRPRQKFVGRSLREIRKSLYDEFTNNGEGDTENRGRSFQELKDAAHIDKLHDAKMNNTRSSVQRMRERQLEDEQFRLQQKLKAFYRNLEIFKGNPNKHNPRTAYTYVYT